MGEFDDKARSTIRAEVEISDEDLVDLEDETWGFSLDNAELSVVMHEFPPQHVFYIKDVLAKGYEFFVNKYFMKLGIYLFEQQGSGPGHSYMNWKRQDMENYEMEFSFVTDEPIASSEKYKIYYKTFEVPEQKYVLCKYKGPKDGPFDLGRVYDKIEAYIIENGYVYTGGTVYQKNFNNTHIVRKNNLYTEIYYPIK